MAKLDKEIDLLYLEPPDGFTTERNALAKRLRADGDRDEAERVAKLKKPSKPAWLVNALALGKPGSIAELLDVTERLRKAVSGGDADAMRSAARDEGRLLERLVGEACELASEAGEKVAPAALDRVRETLQAAQVDPETCERVVAGRLEREERAASFGLDGLTLAALSKPKGKAAPRKREDAAAKRRLQTAREAVASAKRELADADVEASAAVRRREKARAKLKRAEERLSALRSD